MIPVPTSHAVSDGNGSWKLPLPYGGGSILLPCPAGADSKMRPVPVPISVRSIALAFVLALTFTAASLRAELEFEKTELTVKPKPGETRLTATFKFKNTGDTAVTITDITSGCGCTVPTWSREPIPPDGVGEVPVTYATGGRQGRQTQTVHVSTSDGGRQDLVLVADLPVRVSFEPRMLVIGRDSDESKQATVTYSDDTPVTLLGVELGNRAFELTEEPVMKDNVLKFSVRHVGAAGEDARGTVRIRTRGQSGTEHIDLVYLRHLP